MTDESIYALTNDAGTNDAGAGSVGFDARFVVCPGCETRYRVAGEAFKAVEGRRLRCAGCGHSWQYSPEPGATQPAFLDEAISARAAAGRQTATPAADHPVRLEPVVAGEPIFAEQAAQARRPVISTPQQFIGRRGALVTVVGVAGLAAVVVLFAFLGRELVATWHPAAAPLSAKLEPGTATPEIPGAGLKVTVMPMRSADTLIIKGDIVNSADIPRRIPRLRLTLVDGRKIDLDTKIINPPVPQLAPGDTAHFNTVFEHPAIAAVRVNVSFATD